MNLNLCAVVVLIFATTTAHADLYKCQTPQGSVYSETPCTKGTTGKIVVQGDAANSANDPFPNNPELSALRKQYLETQKRFNEYADNHCGGRKLDKVTIGMPEDDLMCVPGFRQAEKKNRTVTGATVRTQNIYTQGRRTVYVYVENGKVTAFQD